MNRQEKRKLARQIARFERKCETNENNILENMKIMESMIKDCSVEDLLEIDEIIMKKYLTN